MLYIVILNTLAIVYLLIKPLSFNHSFRFGKDNKKAEIDESFLEVPENVLKFRERMKGVIVDRDGLYDSPPPSISTDFTGTEIITPSMEVQSDRRF